MRAWCLALAALSLAGCLAGPEPPQEPAGPAPSASASEWSTPCDGCYEPFVLWAGNGSLWLASNSPPGLWRSDDGGLAFTDVALPGTPEGMDGEVFLEQDIALWADGGSLWLTSMVQDDVPNNTGNSVRVARTDDGGATWGTNVVVRWPAEQGDVGHASDRPWVVAKEGSASVAAAQPTGLFVHVAAFQAGRQTDAEPVPLASARATALGRPALAPEGRWVVPFVRNVGPYVDGYLADASLGQLQALVGAVGSAQVEVVTVGQVAGPGAPSSQGVPAAAWDDGFVVASVTPAGTIQLWTSAEGDAWQEGPTVDGGAVVGQPWVEAAAGRRAVAWFRGTGQGVDLVSWDGTGPAVPRVSLPATQTDFPALSLAPDGRLALAWLDDGQLRLRVLPP